MKRKRSAEEARKWLQSHGVTVAAFAKKHRVSRFAVVDLLRGRAMGLRGDSHRAAVLLGMKEAPEGESPLKRP